MCSWRAVVFLSTVLNGIAATRCFYYARNELMPDKIFDYGFINCPPGTKGCFYYPHRQCINGKFRIAYSITGCLGNPDLCDKNELEVKKLNGTARCCYHLGCNFGVYNFLYNLPRGVAQYDSDDKECGPGIVPEKITAHTSAHIPALSSRFSAASSSSSTSSSVLLTEPRSVATKAESESVTTSTGSSTSKYDTSSTSASVDDTSMYDDY